MNSRRAWNTLLVATLIASTPARADEDNHAPGQCPGEDRCEMGKGTKKIVWGSIIGGTGLLLGVLPGTVILLEGRSSLSRDIAPIGIGIGIGAAIAGALLVTFGALNRSRWNAAHPEGLGVTVDVDPNRSGMGLRLFGSF